MQFATMACTAGARAGMVGAESEAVIPSLLDWHRSSESVTITSILPCLRWRGGFSISTIRKMPLQGIIKGLRGIYVRSYTFDKDSAYQQTDIDAVRVQLSAPGWNRLVETHSRKPGPMSISTS